MTIADALILTVPRSTGFAGWVRVGRLAREAHLLRELAPGYGRTVLVTRGGEPNGNDLGLLRDAVGPEHAGSFELIALGGPDGSDGTPAGLESALASRLGGARTAVVQTIELDDAGLALGIGGALGRLGVESALVARGGCVPSRIMAWRHGPHSAEAVGSGDEERRLCAQASVVVGATEAMLDDLTWRFEIDPDTTRLVRTFVPDGPEPAGTSARDPDLLFSWGPLEVSSRHDAVVEAAGRLPERMRSSVRLEIAGEGPERERLADLAAARGVRLSLPGEVGYDAFVERCLRCAVYVHAALYNPEPIGVLDAMSLGAPVIAAESPGAGGLIENGVSGIRVPGSVDSLGYALEGVLPDADWREMLGACAAQRVRSRSAVGKVAAELLSAHVDALSNAGIGAQELRRRSA